jgi:hypothetical protein
MTLDELEHTLPNGLHDAEVRRVTVDYVARTVFMEVEVWVGDMDDPPERREAYRSGRVEISGLLFFIIEPPDPKYPFSDSISLRIDGCDLRKNVDGELLKSMPTGAFFRSFFVNEWNSFIHIAAQKAELVWEPGVITYHTPEHFAPGEIIG